jgi:uncharacterized iron-regulated membrane protein
MTDGPLIRHLKSQRRLWFQVHLYLGLTLGLILSVVSLTGSVLVFWMEIDEFLHPEMIRVAAPKGAPYRSLEEIASSARAALPPGASLYELNFPRHRNAAAICGFGVPNPAAAGEPDAWDMFIDPYTARVTGSRLWYSAESWWKNAFLGILFKIHYALMIRGWGTALVGAMTFFFALLTLTGLYVWWPLSGKWRQALTMVWPVSGPRLSFELHKVSGFYLMPVLTAVLVTGIYLDLSEQVIWALKRVSSVERPGIPQATVPVRLPLTLDEAVDAAQRAFPNSAPYSLLWSRDARSIALEQMVRYRFGFAGRRVVTVDLSSGAISHVADPVHATFGTAYITWQWPLHSGRAWGLPGRILVFLSGLVCPLLLVTGFNRWFWKRRAKQRRSAVPFVPLVSDPGRSSLSQVCRDSWE